jgi:hypothetical protein
MDNTGNTVGFCILDVRPVPLLAWTDRIVLRGQFCPSNGTKDIQLIDPIAAYRRNRKSDPNYPSNFHSFSDELPP